eukprot:m.235879 g.235879  ORF g.235879 m.235879 type:complete len:1292 (-) comp33672_c0_seq1:320-4195(-)
MEEKVLKAFEELNERGSLCLGTLTSEDGSPDILCKCVKEFEQNERLTNATSKEIANICDEIAVAVQKSLGTVAAEVCEYTVEFITEDAEIKPESLVTGRVLELLPKLLSISSVGSDLDDNNSVRAVAVKNLAEHVWPARYVSHAASMFLDITMSDEEHGLVVKGLLKQLSVIPLDEMPSLVYQLLLLANKGKKSVVVKGIIEVVSNMEKRLNDDDEEMTCSFVDPADASSSIGSEALRPIQGTIILHVSFAAKQDQELGREILKYLKSDIELGPFATALALSLSRIQRFEDSALGLLKARVTTYFRNKARQTSSPWLKANVAESSNFGNTLLATVENSASNWDQVAHGLVILATVLMDGCRTDSKEASSYLACELGAKILQQTFELHLDLRPEILDQILSRVIVKSSSATEQYTQLLSQMVHKGPHMMMENVQKIREMFDYISYISVTVACGLLKATMPLIVLCNPLRDSLMLVLRKSMFSRDLNARLIATKGFLLLLEELKVGISPHASQSSSQMMSSNSTNHEALGLEIFGTLKRCTTQQVQVRVSFYSDLATLVKRKPFFKATALDMTKRHLEHFIGDSGTAPLKLQLCVPEDGKSDERPVVVQEPLDRLLACILQLYRCDDVTSDQPHEDLPPFAKAFEKLLQRLIETELETYELDKAADFAAEESDGRRGVVNLMRADVLVGVLQVALNGVSHTSDYKLESCTMMLALWKQIQRIEETVRTKLKKKRKTTGECVFEFEGLVVLIENLSSDMRADHQTGLMVLRNNEAFVKYVLRMAFELIDTPTKLQGRTKLRELFSRLMKICLHEYAAQTSTMIQKIVHNDKSAEKAKDKGRSIKLLCLDILHVITTSAVDKLVPQHNVLHLWRGGLANTNNANNATTNNNTNTNNATTDDNNDNGNNDTTTPLTWLQQRLSLSITAETHRHSNSLIGMISKLISFVERDERIAMTAWVDSLCTRTAITDVTVTRGLLTLLLDAHRQDAEFLDIAIKITKNCLVHRGTVAEKQNQEDHDTNVDGLAVFTVITFDHCRAMVPSLLIHTLGSAIEELEWFNGVQQLTPQTTTLVVLCQRLHQVLEFATELSHVDPEQNFPVAFDTLRHVKRLYDLFLSVVKTQLAIFTKNKKTHELQLEPMVRQLLEQTTLFTQDVYALVSLVNEGPEEEVDDKAKKKKKKTTTMSKANTIESRIIPNLVFAIEQYERHLIQLNDKPGGKENLKLLKNFKRSIVRDFRLKHDAVRQALSERERLENDDSQISGMSEVTAAKKKRKQKQVEPNSGAVKKKKSKTSTQS